MNEITGGKKCPVVYDSVGKDTFYKSLDCVAPLGLLASFGQSSGPYGPVDIGILAGKGSLFLTRPTLNTYTATREDLLTAAARAVRRGAEGHRQARRSTRPIRCATPRRPTATCRTARPPARPYSRCKGRDAALGGVMPAESGNPLAPQA